jgi:uncharacterized protein YggU (UPF0235/DUF167 family)
MLRVRVQPRASRPGVGGARGGALLVRVGAPPLEGAANEALLRLLGRELGVAPSAIRILRGAAGREKVLSVRGLTAEAVRARLRSVLGDAQA